MRHTTPTKEGEKAKEPSTPAPELPTADTAAGEDLSKFAGAGSGAKLPQILSEPATSADTSGSSSAAEEEFAGAGSGAVSPKKLQTITFIGSGQVSAVLAGLIAIHNRTLKPEEKVKISILGKKGSESLSSMAEKGIVLNMPDGTIHTITNEEISFSDNPEELGKQDHIFIAVKTTAYENQATLNDLLTKIEILSKEGVEKDGKKTTITFGQNGIPFWFRVKKEGLASEALASEALDSVDKGNQIFAWSHNKKVVKSVLNFGCSVAYNPDGSIDHHTYNVATAIGKISVPMKSFIEGRNVVALRYIFRNSGISTAVDELSIEKELFLKMQVNASISGLSTITGKTIGEMIDDPELKNVILAVAAEINNLSESITGRTLKTADDLILRLNNSLTHRSSMCRDFESGNQLELKGIYNSVQELSGKYELPRLNVVHKISRILTKMVILRRDEMVGKSGEEINFQEITKVVRGNAEILGKMRDLKVQAAVMLPSPGTAPTGTKPTPSQLAAATTSIIPSSHSL